MMNHVKHCQCSTTVSCGWFFSCWSISAGRWTLPCTCWLEESSERRSEKRSGGLLGYIRDRVSSAWQTVPSRTGTDEPVTWCNLRVVGPPIDMTLWPECDVEQPIGVMASRPEGDVELPLIVITSGTEDDAELPLGVMASRPEGDVKLPLVVITSGTEGDAELPLGVMTSGTWRWRHYDSRHYNVRHWRWRWTAFWRHAVIQWICFGHHHCNDLK